MSELGPKIRTVVDQRRDKLLIPGLEQLELLKLGRKDGREEVFTYREARVRVDESLE